MLLQLRLLLYLTPLVAVTAAPLQPRATFPSSSTTAFSNSWVLIVIIVGAIAAFFIFGTIIFRCVRNADHAMTIRSPRRRVPQQMASAPTGTVPTLSYPAPPLAYSFPRPPPPSHSPLSASTRSPIRSTTIRAQTTRNTSRSGSTARPSVPRTETTDPLPTYESAYDAPLSPTRVGRSSRPVSLVSEEGVVGMVSRNGAPPPYVR
ncbi:hypothetical protein JCM24511_09233 [Saitozyma sp. JCM 24511]|nr:hypothetical protein JCM24511_09233 [Saitozyma sp. JCM 24511]